MKRLVFLLLFFMSMVSLTFAQNITVLGTVNDTSGNPITGGKVFLHYNIDTTSRIVPVVNGAYSAVMPRPIEADSLIAEFWGCVNNFSVGKNVDLQTGDTVSMPPMYIDCEPEIIVTVTGQVVDTLGLPVPNIQVMTYAYPDYQSVTTDGGGYFSFDVYMPSTDDSLLTLRVIDRCGNSKLVHTKLHYPDTTRVNIVVECGLNPRVVVDGRLIDPGNRFLTEVVVWAKEGTDTTKYLGVADDSARFVFELPVPAANTPIYLWVDELDTQGVVMQARDTISFDGINYFYTSSITLDQSSEPTRLMHVTGAVWDSSDSYVAGATVRAWYKSIPDKKAIAITDDNGRYDLTLIPSLLKRDTIRIEATDVCNNIFSVDTVMDFYNNFLTYDFYNVPCHGKAPLVEVSGYVKDEKGHPVPGIEVYVEPDIQNGSSGGNFTKVTDLNGGNDYSCVTNQYGFYKIVFPAPSTHPMNFLVNVYDVCNFHYVQPFSFDYPQLTYEHIDFSIKCPEENMYTWEGFVRDGANNPLPGVQVMGWPHIDSTNVIVTVTDENGHYKFQVGDPMDSLVIAQVVDGCQNVLLDTFLFNPQQYNYVRDYTMQCAGTMPDSVLNFWGYITDNAGSPVENEFVLVSVISNNGQDSTGVYTVSDSTGFYSVSLPLPNSQALIYELVKDNCDSVYEVKDTFDFSTYFIHHDFQVACPPTYTIIRPKVDVGYQPDWQDYNTFTFYAQVRNIPDTMIRAYVWRLLFDTIATQVPSITYTFPAMDTCFDVGVKIITNDGKEVRSPLLMVCIQDPFAELGDSCYADFFVAREDISQNVFAFVPFIQSESGLTPYQATWDFGDSSSLTITAPDTVDKVVTHQYTTHGVYDVTYTVIFQDTANNTCVTTWTDPVWVGHDVWYPDSCAAVFYIVLDSTDYKKVHFEDISYPGDSAQIEYYNWDFGDGNIDYAPSPTHVFDTVGQYDVSMKIITNRGCADERQVTVKIQQGLEPLFFFPDTVYKSGKGYAVKYRNISKTKSDKWGWDFGDAEKKSLLKVSTDTVVHVYADTGVYKVTLTNLNTGASVSMNVHVASTSQVEPLSVILTPAPSTSTFVDSYDIERLTLYPNPATDVLNVKLPESADQVKLEIINLTGQIVRTVYAYNTDYLKIKVKDLPSGTYIIRTTRDNKIALSRFIKQ